MEIRNPCLLLVLLLSCFFVAHGINRQGEALNNFYETKYRGSSGIDTSPFVAMDVTLFDHEENKDVDDQEVYNPDHHHHHHNHKGLKEKDRLKRLPGQPPVNFLQYGGYVTVNESAGRALYYYFAEAEHSKESLPLLLWLNGGPGCSSLAYGAMQELGPFRAYSDGKTLFTNKYSWNKVANVLFLESPAGVGFSYSNTTSDYAKSGDRRTATDNYVFLVNWLKRFPEYKDRDLYISGESYAGHYVPQLAHTILHHNKKANRTIINLKGILIGNAVINDETDTHGMYDYFGTHALISYKNMRQIQQFCNFSPRVNQSRKCTASTKSADKVFDEIDIYNIYGPQCFDGNLTAKPKKASVLNFDPCSDYYVYAYLNRPEVQEAMHANVTNLTHDWEPCSDIISTWLDSPSTIIPLLREFMANGLRVWVFSGDTDGRVPVTSTQYSINRMRLPIKTEWYPWYKSGLVGGYAQVYEGDLTFATVRGAGHQVPTFQPIRALSLITHFLAGTPLPKGSSST